MADSKRSVFERLFGVPERDELVVELRARLDEMQQRLVPAEDSRCKFDALGKSTAIMEELNGALRQTADNARKASDLAVGASDVAARGGDAVAGVVETMRSIHESPKRSSRSSR
jgi:methyl-accepting chemotaxis protein